MAEFTIYRDRSGYYRWRLTAANGRIIADGAEGYVQKSDAKAGVDFVKTHASGSTTDDQA